MMVVPRQGRLTTRQKVMSHCCQPRAVRGVTSGRHPRPAGDAGLAPCWRLLQVLIDDLLDLLLFISTELHRIAALADIKTKQADRFFHGGG